MKKFTALGAVLCVLLLFAPLAQATIVSQLGDQDFADGQSPIYSSDITTLGAGEPYPFDGTSFGDDRFAGQLGDFSYTHTFDLGCGTPTSANLTLGLLDHDSYAYGGSPARDTIDIFFDGIQQPDSQFLGISINPSSASVVTMSVPISLLLDGSLTVRVVATDTAPNFPGNSLAADFSLLEIEATCDPIPEPLTLCLVGTGLLGLAGLRRRKS